MEEIALVAAPDDLEASTVEGLWQQLPLLKGRGELSVIHWYSRVAEGSLV